MVNNKEILSNFKISFDTFYNLKENSRQKSSHWNRYNSRKYSEEQLINFRSRNGLSSGLDDQIINVDFKFLYEVFDYITEEYVLKNCLESNIGNSYSSIKYKDVFLDHNKLIHIVWFNLVEKSLLKKRKVKHVCEIGGGFGSFSELFVKNYNVHI